MNKYRYLLLIILLLWLYSSYLDSIPIHSIVFYHNHVNGDCFSSRIFVKHIIDHMPNLNYYYTAPRSLISHCKDIGIPDENFNKKSIPFFNNLTSDENPNYLNFFSNKNGYLYINVWIGNALKINSNNKLCWLCGSKYLDMYNYIIILLNQTYNLNMNLIETKNPYISLNYDYYDCYFLDDYMIKQKQKYNKIVLYYNLPVNSMTDLNNIDYNQVLLNINDPNILYITFLPSKITYNNVISIKEIYNNYNKVLPIGFGIQFSYLSIYCDKIISLASGSAMSILNWQNKFIKNKILMITSNNLDTTVLPISHDDYSKKSACVAKFDWYITIYNYSENNDNNMLYNYLNKFINN
jgi:hypothetical protein